MLLGSSATGRGSSDTTSTLIVGGSGNFKSSPAVDAETPPTEAAAEEMGQQRMATTDGGQHCTGLQAATHLAGLQQLGRRSEHAEISVFETAMIAVITAITRMGRVTEYLMSYLLSSFVHAMVAPYSQDVVV